MEEIPDNELKENFSKFTKVLEKHIARLDEKELDSKTLIKEFLNDPKLFSGIELTLHSIITAAVKVSVKSQIAGLNSGYLEQI